MDREPLFLTWSPSDSESGIKECRACIVFDGSTNCSSSLSDIRTVVGPPFTTVFDNITFDVSNDTRKVLYRAYIEAINNAGASSGVVASKPFIVLKANVAGTVTDGTLPSDVDFSNDKSSVSTTFSGFESEACGIDGYEWGVGSTPFATDIVPYTDYGLVVDGEGVGFSNIHIALGETRSYFSSVRAITGYNCHEKYIVASSDGFTVDTTPPIITFQVGNHKVTSRDVVYQTQGDSFKIKWTAVDSSGLNASLLTVRIFDIAPYTESVLAISNEPLPLSSSLSSGDTLFSTILLKDTAGNEVIHALPVLTVDSTPPLFVGVNCTEEVSIASSHVTCSWLTVEEAESALQTIQLGVGSEPSTPDLVNMTAVPIYSQKWTYDTGSIISSRDITVFYVIVWAVNVAGLEAKSSVKVVIDVTPPSIASVSIVTSADGRPHSATCQTSEDYIEVLVVGLKDEESTISR